MEEREEEEDVWLNREEGEGGQGEEREREREKGATTGWLVEAAALPLPSDSAQISLLSTVWRLCVRGNLTQRERGEGGKGRHCWREEREGEGLPEKERGREGEMAEEEEEGETLHWGRRHPGRGETFGDGSGGGGGGSLVRRCDAIPICLSCCLCLCFLAGTWNLRTNIMALF